MLVYTFTPDSEGLMHIRKDLDSIKAYVGDIFNVIRLTRDLDLVFNNETNLSCELEPSACLVKNGRFSMVIYGKCFVCGDYCGDVCSIKKASIPTIKSFLFRCK